MQISYRYQSTDLEMNDWRMWRHEWFSQIINVFVVMEITQVGGGGYFNKKSQETLTKH